MCGLIFNWNNDFNVILIFFRKKKSLIILISRKTGKKYNKQLIVLFLSFFSIINEIIIYLPSLFIYDWKICLIEERIIVVAVVVVLLGFFICCLHFHYYEIFSSGGGVLTKQYLNQFLIIRNLFTSGPTSFAQLWKKKQLNKRILYRELKVNKNFTSKLGEFRIR